MPEGRHGAEIDAKTHQKTMLKLVTKTIRKITDNHVFPMCQSMQIHSTAVKKKQQGSETSVREHEIHKINIAHEI